MAKVSKADQKASEAYRDAALDELVKVFHNFKHGPADSVEEITGMAERFIAMFEDSFDAGYESGMQDGLKAGAGAVLDRFGVSGDVFVTRRMGVDQ